MKERPARRNGHRSEMEGGGMKGRSDEERRRAGEGGSGRRRDD